jgi:hypothetical protein
MQTKFSLPMPFSGDSIWRAEERKRKRERKGTFPPICNIGSGLF